MPSFPFSGRGGSKKKSRSRRKMQKASFWVVEDVGLSEEKESCDFGSKISSECLEHNLLLAQLFCSLELMKSSGKRDKKQPNARNYLDSVLKFLSLAIEDAELCHRHERQISAIVWTLVTSGRLGKRDDDDGKLRLNVRRIEPIINSLAECNPKECPLRGDSCVSNCLLFKLLCNIIKERSLEELHSSKSLEEWVEKLPDILPLSNYQSIKVLNEMARQCNLPVFHSTLKAILPKIFFLLRNEPKYLEKTEELKTSLALLHWVRDWDAEELINLEDIVQRFPKETSSLIEIFRARKEYQGKSSKLSLLLDSLPWWQRQTMSLVKC